MCLLSNLELDPKDGLVVPELTPDSLGVVYDVFFLYVAALATPVTTVAMVENTWSGP